ncbi:hypothetical protein NQ317_002903 [Molorchus minor]|uniref:Uncharacterized protein n=1 Tax=Molorchus minor TaxID=1323400 RepID=A0ABQ9JID0_9CUCU|nr:hypothetical protein NQ317_002903 [Molorchus minor]
MSERITDIFLQLFLEKNSDGTKHLRLKGNELLSENKVFKLLLCTYVKYFRLLLSSGQVFGFLGILDD